MNRRDLYAFVQQLAAEHSPRRVLDALAAAMRQLRNLPHAAHPLASLLSTPDLLPLLSCDDALGQVYQAINAPALESAYRATTRDRRKFHEHEIPAVTQLFTPRWVVEFILQNTLGRLWLDLHPDSRLRAAWTWLVPVPPRPTPPRLASSLRILDPACGTMNFGLVAIELLDAIYREELDRAGQPTWPAQPSVPSPDLIPASIAQHNLTGIDIDPLALDLARQTLSMKWGDHPWHLIQADALFDPALESFRNTFDAVVTNPPYLSSRNLSPETVRRLKIRYPAAHRDLYACFIDRSLDLLRDTGRAGLLTMQSFMFTGGYEPLRQKIHDRSALETLAHFGPALFDIGNPGTLQTVAFVLRRESDHAARARQTIHAFRLVDHPNESAKRQSLSAAIGGTAGIAIEQSDLIAFPRAAWAYWISPSLRRCFSTFPRLATIAPPRQGLATTDNARFVRHWWEIPPTGNRQSPIGNPRWFPYVKGAGFRRWYRAPQHWVNWQDDGREIKQSICDRYPYLKGDWQWVAKNSSFYGRQGVTWSYLTSGTFSARYLPPGAIFDVAGSSLFPADPYAMLAILNSSVARELLGLINPTVNFQVGDLSQLPLPANTTPELAALARSAIAIQQRLDCFDETTPDFTAPLPWTDADDIHAQLHTELARIEHTADSAVAELYGQPSPPTPPQSPPPLDRCDLARRWVSHALQIHLNRSPDPIPLIPRCANPLHDILAGLLDSPSLAQIDQTLNGIDAFLINGFSPWHIRLYRNRPTCWRLSLADRQYLLPHAHATAATLQPLFRAHAQTLPAGWDRFIDDGIALNLAPLIEWIADPSLRRALQPLARDLSAGRYPWARTSSALLINQ